jgi:hypothetical protein
MSSASRYTDRAAIAVIRDQAGYGEHPQRVVGLALRLPEGEREIGRRKSLADIEGVEDADAEGVGELCEHAGQPGHVLGAQQASARVGHPARVDGVVVGMNVSSLCRSRPCLIAASPYG